MAVFHCTSRKFHSIPPSIPMEISSNFLVLQDPPPLRKFESLLWGKYGYFIDRTNAIGVHPQRYKKTIFYENIYDHFLRWLRNTT